MMMDDVDRLTSFIDDVLQASRLAHDDVVGMALEDVPLAAFARHVVEHTTTRLKLPEGAVTIQIADALVAYTDRAALEIVLRNLIDNAAKYSRDPVRITIRARHDAKATVLEVQDEGIGIPRSELKRIFHRFYRAPAESVRKRKGTGLGLFVVSALVRNLGGTVEAMSEGEGRGSTFVVRLPLQAPRAVPAAVEARVAAEPRRAEEHGGQRQHEAPGRRRRRAPRDGPQAEPRARGLRGAGRPRRPRGREAHRRRPASARSCST